MTIKITLARPINILLIEDNPGDVRLTREALLSAKVLNHMHVVIDGIQTMKFLRKEGEYQNVVTPDLILLDLNLPKMGGREVLEQIKADESLKDIPIVILTSSDDERDMVRSYEIGADFYITKPIQIEKFLEAIKTFNHFWVTFVKVE